MKNPKVITITVTLGEEQLKEIEAHANRRDYSAETFLSSLVTEGICDIVSEAWNDEEDDYTVNVQVKS